MATLLKIFLASHGHLASGMKSSLEILMGPTHNLTVFDAYTQGNDESVSNKLDQFYKEVKPDDTVLLCSDLYGGSVNNEMYRYLDRPNTKLVAGINLAFLLEVLNESADRLTDDRLKEIIANSRKFLMRVDCVPSSNGSSVNNLTEDFF